MPPEAPDTSKITDPPLTEQQYLENAIKALEAQDAAGDPAAEATEPTGDEQPAESGEIEAADGEKDEAKADDPVDPAAPKTEVAPPTEEPPPVAAEPERDVLAELDQAIRQRASRREEPNTEISSLKQQIADMQRQLQERKTNDEYEEIVKLVKAGRWKEVAEKGGHDPLAAYESFTKQAADGEKDSLVRKIEAIERRWEEREKAEKADRERAEQEAAHRQAEHARQQAIVGFLEFTKPSPEPGAAYPHVRAASEDKRARDALHFASRLAQAGREVTYVAVAELMEAEYSRLARAWAPKTAAPTETAAEDKPKRTKGAAPAADRGEPKTISNALAAQSSGPDDRPKRSDEYFADMMRVLESS